MKRWKEEQRTHGRNINNRMVGLNSTIALIMFIVNGLNAQLKSRNCQTG